MTISDLLYSAGHHIWENRVKYSGSAAWLYSVYASSLRKPKETSSQAYVSYYAIVNFVAGALSRMKAGFNVVDPMVKTPDTVIEAIPDGSKIIPPAKDGTPKDS